MTLEVKRIDRSIQRPLAEFFEALRAAGDETYFHPHPLNAQEAHRLSTASGRDLYYALVDANHVLGYGMLRGWDEGYETPSLGIAIHPAFRESGFGELLMVFLHAAARGRGARRIRLTVARDNPKAVALFRKAGYQLQPTDDGRLIGTIDLDGPERVAERQAAR